MTAFSRQTKESKGIVWELFATLPRCAGVIRQLVEGFHRFLGFINLTVAILPDGFVGNVFQCSLFVDVLLGHGDFIQNKVKAAHELGRYIRGEDLLVYVRDYLEKEFLGTRVIASEANPLETTLELSVDGRVHLNQFLQANRLQGRTAVLANAPPRLLFDNKLGVPPKGLEKVTQDLLGCLR